MLALIALDPEDADAIDRMTTHDHIEQYAMQDGLKRDMHAPIAEADQDDWHGAIKALATKCDAMPHGPQITIRNVLSAIDFFQDEFKKFGWDAQIVSKANPLNEQAVLSESLEISAPLMKSKTRSL